MMHIPLIYNIVCQSILKCRLYSRTSSVPIMKKKKINKIGQAIEKKETPVETDPHRLVNYVCGSNSFKSGEDVKLKADSAYPVWLWSLKVNNIPSIKEIDQSTKQYWRKLRKINLRRNNQLSSLKNF